MKTLRLAVDADLTMASLEAAVDLMQAAGEEKPYLQLIVAPDEVTETRRLLDQIMATRPGSLLALCAKAGHVQGNYLWDAPGMRSRWVLVGKDCIVYTSGGG